MKNNWSKTLLYVYKYLERVCDGIDKLVEQNAMNSFYFCQSRSENEVSAVTNRIIKLCERKARLVNIKVLVDSCLLKCDELSAQLLIEKYMDDDTSDIIAQRHNFNVRTYFRRLIQAETTFNSFLLREGFNAKKLENYLAGEKWIIEVVEKFNAESELDYEKELV